MSDHVAEDTVIYIVPQAGKAVPFDLVTSLLRAVGSMYPGTSMGPGYNWAGHTDGFSLHIPAADRHAGPALNPDLVPERAEPTVETVNSGVTGWDGQTLSVLPPQEVSQALAVWALRMLSAYDDAENYVEQTAVTPDGRQLAVVACWSPQRTPHQLRVRAEARAIAAEAEAARLREQLAALGHPDGGPR